MFKDLSEPTSAAMAYGYLEEENGRPIKTEKKVLIFDFGGKIIVCHSYFLLLLGGTFNVSLVSIENGVYEVKSVSYGDANLVATTSNPGQWNISQWNSKRSTKKDLRESDRALRKLRTA